MSVDGFARHTPTLTFKREARVIFVDIALLPDISDAITQLTDESEWYAVGDSVEAVVGEVMQAVWGWYGGNMFIGKIAAFLGVLPVGWLPLDGTTYAVSDYPELAIQLDSQYISGSSFTLPDLSGLFLVGADGVTYELGDAGGEAAHTLTTAEMPAHGHTYTPPVANIDLEAPGAPDILAAGVGTSANTGQAGSGEAHENRPPYYAVVYGIFAGRVV